MHAKTRQALTRCVRPRRVVVALVVFLSLGGLGGGLASAAESKLDPGQAPFHLAFPQAGDRVRYEYQGPTEGHTVAWLGSPWLEFQWEPDVMTFDRTGHSLLANQVRVQSVLPGGDNRTLDVAWLLRPGSGEIVATAQQRHTATQQDGTSASYDLVQTDFVAGSSGLPCGMRTILQGLDVELRPHRLRDTMACANYPGPDKPALTDGSSNPWALEVGGLQTKDGVRYLLVDERQETCLCLGHHYFRYWYREDTPYPVRIEGRDQTEGALVLTGFERGGQQVAQSEVGPNLAVPALAMVPATFTGPDDAGIQHPFPLSRAFQMARDDPDVGGPLKDYLAAHPHAAVVRADSSHQQSSRPREGESWQWSIELSDGTSLLTLDATRTVSVDGVASDRPPASPAPSPTPSAPVLPPPPSVPVPWPSPVPTLPVPAPNATAEAGRPATTYSFNVGSPQDARGMGLPDEAHRPTMLPTAPSLWSSWHAYASPTYQNRTPDFWSYQVTCDESCMGGAGPDITLRAGFSLANRSYPEAQGQDWGAPHDVTQSSVVSWLAKPAPFNFSLDHAYEYSEQRGDWIRHANAPPTRTASAPSGSYRLPHAPLVSLAGLWSFPAGATGAAVGLGAAAAALAYVLWPVARLGTAGLFSRVERDALLDHPVRSDLLQRIEASPGIHHQALVRGTGRGRGTIDHHLRKLVEGGLVRRVQGTGFTCFFPKATAPATIAAAPVLKSDVARRVAERLAADPTRSQGSLARELGVSVPTVNYHVQRLRQAGVLPHGGPAGVAA